MEGIFGILNFNEKDPITEYDLKNMGKVLGNSANLFYEKNFGFGMNRLCVIKEVQSDYPSFNEDETIAAVMNGEIYNYSELKDELIKRKHSIDNTDIGLIPHLYEEFGDSFGKYINGQFSIALWDDSKKTLLFMRDRFGGLNPLHYTMTKNNLIFSSQIRGILQNPEIKREIDLYSLRAYFTHLYIPSPDTIFKGIKKISPGTLLKIKDGKLTTQSYWDFEFPERRITDERYAVKKLIELMEDSIKRRLISDVGIGSFLSGGIDSSINVALASKLLEEPLHTFSIGFDNPEFSELPYAKITSDHFGTEHHEFIINEKHLDCLPKLAWEMEEPFADHGAMLMYFNQNLAKKYTGAVLCGDGSDQLFGYFSKYVRRIRKFEKIPGWPILRNCLSQICNPQRFYIVNFHTKLKLLISDNPEECFFFRPRFIESEFYSNDIYSEMKNMKIEPSYKRFKTFTEADDFFIENYDIKHFLNECVLVGSGRTANINSIANRPTYLDNNVVDFINSLSTELRFKDNIRKYLLKKIASEMLPKEILERRKTGRGVPIQEFLMNPEFKDGIFQTLSELTSKKYFDKYCVEKLEKRLSKMLKLVKSQEYTREKRVSNVMSRYYKICTSPLQAFTLYMFELWYRAYIENFDTDSRKFKSDFV